MTGELEWGVSTGFFFSSGPVSVGNSDRWIEKFWNFLENPVFAMGEWGTFIHANELAWLSSLNHETMYVGQWWCFIYYHFKKAPKLIDKKKKMCYTVHIDGSSRFCLIHPDKPIVTGDKRRGENAVAGVVHILNRPTTLGKLGNLHPPPPFFLKNIYNLQSYHFCPPTASE